MSIIRGMSFIFVTEYFCLKTFIYFTNFFLLFIHVKALFWYHIQSTTAERKKCQKVIKEKTKQRKCKKKVWVTCGKTQVEWWRKKWYILYTVLCVHIKVVINLFRSFCQTQQKTGKRKTCKKYPSFFRVYQTKQINCTMQILFW